MTPQTTLRLVVGFVVGISAGLLGGLLRTPQDAPPDSSAAEAADLPQDRFGSPSDVPPPKAR